MLTSIPEINKNYAPHIWIHFTEDGQYKFYTKRIDIIKVDIFYKSVLSMIPDNLKPCLGHTINFDVQNSDEKCVIDVCLKFGSHM